MADMKEEMTKDIPDYCMPENLPILYHWNGRAINLCISMIFPLWHSDPDAALQPIAKAPVLYVYITQLFVWVASPRFRAVAIGPTDMQRENIGSNAMS